MEQKVTCPQCGAMGIVGSICEYCGAKILLPVVEQDKLDEQSDFLIIPNEISAEDVRQLILKKLVDTDGVPPDIFEKMEFDISWEYLPMYNFEVSYKAEWGGRLINNVIKILCYANEQLAGQIDDKGYCGNAIIKNNFDDIREYLSNDAVQSQYHIFNKLDIRKYVERNRIYSSFSYQKMGAELIYIPYWNVSYTYKEKTYKAAKFRGNDALNSIVIDTPKEESHTEEYKSLIRCEKKIDSQFNSGCFIMILYLILCIILIVCIRDVSFISDYPVLSSIVMTIVMIIYGFVMLLNVGPSGYEVRKYRQSIAKVEKYNRYTNAVKFQKLENVIMGRPKLEKEPEIRSSKGDWLWLLLPVLIILGIIIFNKYRFYFYLRCML